MTQSKLPRDLIEVDFELPLCWRFVGRYAKVKYFEPDIICSRRSPVRRDVQIQRGVIWNADLAHLLFRVDEEWFTAFDTYKLFYIEGPRYSFFGGNVDARIWYRISRPAPIALREGETLMQFLLKHQLVWVIDNMGNKV